MQTRLDIIDIFEEAQRKATPPKLSRWLLSSEADMVDVRWLRRSRCLMCGHVNTKHRAHSAEHCAVLLAHGEEGLSKELRKEKNARYASRNPRRSYKTAWAAEKYIATADQRQEKAIAERVNKLRAGFVPKLWGKLWKRAREQLAREKAG